MFFKNLVLAPAIACVTVVTMTIPALAEIAIVNTNALPVRSGPGESYPSNYTLRRGDKVEVIKRTGNWAQIVGEKGGEGWVFATYLSSSNPPTGSGNLASVITSFLNVRSGPGRSYPITYKLQRGDKVEIIRSSGSWAFIVGARGGEGWVYAPFLSTSSSGNSAEFNRIRGQILGTVADFSSGYLQKNGFKLSQTANQTNGTIVETWRRSSDGLTLQVVLETSSPPPNVIEVRQVK
jgi:uncharacterized protein YgiM (DUF1202 family)